MMRGCKVNTGALQTGAQKGKRGGTFIIVKGQKRYIDPTRNEAVAHNFGTAMGAIAKGAKIQKERTDLERSAALATAKIKRAGRHDSAARIHAASDYLEKAKKAGLPRSLLARALDRTSDMKQYSLGRTQNERGAVKAAHPDEWHTEKELAVENRIKKRSINLRKLKV